MSFYVVALALLVGATIVAIQWPIVLPITVVAVAFTVAAIKVPYGVSALLVLAAVPLMRPGILGERLALGGAILCLLGALLAFASDRGRTHVHRSYLTVVVCLAALSGWLLINASIFHAASAVQNILQGMVTTVLAVAAAGVVLADERRRRIFGLGFVWACVVIGASYAVTLALWVIGGFGAFHLFDFAISDTWTASIYFPFTISTGTQTIFGVTFPRLTGIGREPGWMALFAAVAFFIWGRVGRPRMLGRALLVLGVLGTISTAGFGAFVVVLVVAWIARKPRDGDLFTRYVGLLGKLAVLAGALWLAVAAPVLGIASKGALNATSLDDRTVATMAGINALSQSPLGGVHVATQEAISLIAAVAPFGIPYAVIVCGALFLPRITHPRKAYTTAVLAMVFIILLLSEPAGDAPLVFILVGLTYLLALPRQELDPLIELDDAGGPAAHVMTRAGS